MLQIEEWSKDVTEPRWHNPLQQRERIANLIGATLIWYTALEIEELLVVIGEPAVQQATESRTSYLRDSNRFWHRCNRPVVWPILSQLLMRPYGGTARLLLDADMTRPTGVAGTAIPPLTALTKRLFKTLGSESIAARPPPIQKITLGITSNECPRLSTLRAKLAVFLQSGA